MARYGMILVSIGVSKQKNDQCGKCGLRTQFSQHAGLCDQNLWQMRSKYSIFDIFWSFSTKLPVLRTLSTNSTFVTDFGHSEQHWKVWYTEYALQICHRFWSLRKDLHDQKVEYVLHICHIGHSRQNCQFSGHWVRSRHLPQILVPRNNTERYNTDT